MKFEKFFSYFRNTPKRYILVLLCFIGLLWAFCVRSCISIAIVKMVSQPNKNVSTDITFDWSQKTQGAILSTFFIGNTVSLFFAGYLAETFGGKWTLGLGILLSAISAVLTPLLVEIGGATAMILLRILSGLGQGTMFPALGTLIANWIPKEDRSFIGSAVMGAGQLGSIFGIPVSSFLMEKFNGWSSVFYVFGTLSILWFIAFSIICYDDPKSHPTITEKERNLIERSLGQLKRKDNLSVPWKEVLTNGPFIALLVVQVGHDWGFFIMALNLSKYLNDVLKFRIQTNGLISGAAYLVMWIFSLIVGYLSNWLIRQDHMKLTNVRKLFASITNIGFGIFCLFASYAGLNQIAATTCILIACTLNGAFFASIRLNAIDLTSNYAGTVIATTNGIGSVTGLVGPYVAGILTPNATLEEWRVVFWISFVLLTVSSLVYCFWGSGEQQTWNNIEKKSANTTADETITTKL